MEGQGTGGPNLEPRVRQLEHSVDSLHADMARVSQAVSGVSSQVSSMAKALDVVAEKLDAHRTKRPDWGVFVSMGALLLAIGAATLWPINQRVSLVEIQQQYDQQVRSERGELIGGVTSALGYLQAEIDRLEKRADRLEERIDRPGG